MALDLTSALNSGGLTYDAGQQINGLTLNTPIDTQSFTALAGYPQATTTDTPAVLGDNNTSTAVQSYTPGGGITPDGTYSAGYHGPASAEDKVRGDINSGFDAYLRSLDEQAGLLPEHYQALQDNVNSLYGGQKGTIDTQRANTDLELDNSNNQVDASQAKTLRSLSDSFSQALDAGNQKLGSYGASDSSASPMYAYALSLQDNKNRGNVLEQTNAMKNDINLKRTTLHNSLNDQINQLDTWKNTQLSSLAQWLTDQKSKFAGAKGMAEQQRSQALASLDQAALGRLQQLDDQFTQYKQGLTQWGLQHQGQLDSILAQLGQGAQVATPQHTQQTLNSAINLSSQATPQDLFGYNPFGGGKTDQYGNPI